MKRVWPVDGPKDRYGGYFKLSYNPMSLFFKEITKKNKKTA